MSQISASPRRKFYKRAIGCGILALIIIVPATHFLWGVWAANRLHASLAALHAAGEPITAAELKLDSVPDAQNASLDYLAAGGSIDTATQAWKDFDSSASGSFRFPLTDAEKATIHGISQENTVALADVAAARGKLPGGWNDPLTNPDVLTKYKLDGPRSLTQLLKFAAYESHIRGDDQTALQHVQDALAVAHAAEHRPTLIGHLVAIGCTALASDIVSRLAPELHVGSNRLTREDLTYLLRLFEDESAINAGNQLSWRSERIVAINTMRELANGILSTPVLAGSSSPSYPTTSRFWGYAIKPLVLTDARLYANYLQGLIRAQTAPDWATAYAQQPTQILALKNAHPYQHLFLNILVAGVEKAGRADYLAKSQCRLAVASLAVRLYAADHHDQLPSSLADLVPAYLPAIPADAMNGAPLRYKSDPPRIYALGNDGVDYGGIPQDLDSSDKTRRRHGDLVVYLVTQPRKLP